MPRRILYERAPIEEDTSPFLLNSILPFEGQIRAADGSDRRRCRWTVFKQVRSVYIALLLCLAILGPWCWIAWTVVRPHDIQKCIAETSAYSPALEAVKHYDTDFKNSFGEKSLYRGPPTPELEEAWSRLWDQPGVLIPPEGMAQLNRSGELLEQYMKAPEEEGNGYVGGLEVFHQLHCLNYIRQFTWYAMGKYTDVTLPLELHLPLKALRMHTDHCIETLRLVLMCQSDVSPVLVKWSSDDPPIPQAEFSSHHRCRNFDDILSWNEQHALKNVFLPKEHTHHDQ